VGQADDSAGFLSVLDEDMAIAEALAVRAFVHGYGENFSEL